MVVYQRRMPPPHLHRVKCQTGDVPTTICKPRPMQIVGLLFSRRPHPAPREGKGGRCGGEPPPPAFGTGNRCSEQLADRQGALCNAQPALGLHPPRERIGWAGRHDSTERLRLRWNNLVDIGAKLFSKLVEQMEL